MANSSERLFIDALSAIQSDGGSSTSVIGADCSPDVRARIADALYSTTDRKPKNYSGAPRAKFRIRNHRSSRYRA